MTSTSVRRDRGRRYRARVLPGRFHLAALAFVLGGCATPSEPCPCADGHGVTLCDGGECTDCQCLTLAAPTPDPVPAITRFVDAGASGGDGSEVAPWATP